MSAFWWYLAGVATLPALLLAWIIVGTIYGLVTGTGSFVLRTTVNGRVTERTWGPMIREEWRP